MVNQNNTEIIFHSNSYIGQNGTIISGGLEKPTPHQVTNELEPENNIGQPPSAAMSFCAICRKKLRLACQFKCRCGNMHCAKHMHSVDHNCAFDYKKFQREKLTNELEQMCAQKLSRI